MQKKFLIPLFLLTLFLAISSVSASENATDVLDISEVETNDVSNVRDISSDNEVLSDDDSSQITQMAENQLLGDNSSSEIVKSKSSVSASKVTGYESFTTQFVVKLLIDGKAASGKKVLINVDDKNYTRKTDDKGKATLNIKLLKGTYKVKFSYAGDENVTSSKGSSKITVKESLKTEFRVDKYINFRQGLKSLFYVKLVDKNSKAVKGQMVTIKVAGKTYKVKTTKKGYARLFLSLKKGNYKIKCSFSKKQPYLSSSKTVKIKVRAKMVKGNGYWLWPMHMSSIDLKKLASRGTKNIFLLGSAVSSYGKSYVVSWIKRANSYGMKVHMWMLVCYDGDWAYPVKHDGSYKHAFINQKINEAKYYAKIKGVAGVHLDYMRFGGTAHNYVNSKESITYVVKKISYAVHKIKPNAIVSVAVMPEPKMMLYYYGQDIPVLSRYVDALLPMAYKSAYGKSTNWIKSVTKTFAKQSNGAKIWTGIESYKSENNPVSLSHKELMKNARAAMAGGAAGVVIFRIGLTNYLDFKKV